MSSHLSEDIVRAVFKALDHPAFDWNIISAEEWDALFDEACTRVETLLEIDRQGR